MKDIKDAIRDLCASWEKEAQQRAARTPHDPAAAAMQSCAFEVLAALDRLERETAVLSVAQYAAEHAVHESTVRRLCERGQLEGAIKGANNEWRIPHDARRLERPKMSA